MSRFVEIEGDGAVCNMGYPFETHLKPKSREISFARNLFLNFPIVLKFCIEHGSITCSVQNFKTIGQPKRMLRANEVSRDLGLRWVSDKVPGWTFCACQAICRHNAKQVQVPYLYDTGNAVVRISYISYPSWFFIAKIPSTMAEAHAYIIITPRDNNPQTCPLLSVEVIAQQDAESDLFNSLTPGSPGCHCKTAIFNLVLLIGVFRSSDDNGLKWMSSDLTDDKSALVQVMVWCRQATSHYLSQCWPSSMSPYGVTRPQWVNSLIPEESDFQF